MAPGQLAPISRRPERRVGARCDRAGGGITLLDAIIGSGRPIGPPADGLGRAGERAEESKEGSDVGERIHRDLSSVRSAV